MKLSIISLFSQKVVMAASCLSVFLGFMASPVMASQALVNIIEDIKQDYDVEHISYSEFGQLPKEEVVVFDVRRPVEYQVGHLEGAVQLDPGMSSKRFLAKHGDKLAGKKVVFYCSVGLRSSRMAERLKTVLGQAGAKEAYNLEGGAFRWHNQNLSFVKQGETTREIHPYNAYYGRMINDQTWVRYK